MVFRACLRRLLSAASPAKGLGSYNQRFNNTSTVVWELPYGKGRRWSSSGNPVLTGVLGGWRVTGINTITAGQPVNISYGRPTAFQVSTLAPTYRPNYVGAVSIRPSAVRPTISTSQPSAPSTATPNDPSSPLGNLGRNVATTNGIYDFDFGLHKEFPLKREGMRIEFRSEFFNLFNKSNLGRRRRTCWRGTSARSRALASPARPIQFALKFAS